VVEGNVVDELTRRPLWGATIIARGRAENVGISDESGRYSIDLRPGAYRLRVVYGESDVEAGNIEVAAQKTLLRDIEVSHFAVAEATASALRPYCPSSPRGVAPSHARRAALVSAVLKRFADDEAVIPDGRLLTRIRTPVVSDGDAISLPVSGARTYARTSLRELRAVADRSGQEQLYLGIEVELEGTCATVKAGVHYVIPSRSTRFFSCCCNTIDIYEEADGRWAFRGNVDERCR